MNERGSSGHCAASDLVTEKSAGFSCCCPALDGSDQSECFHQMTDGGQLVSPHCTCLVRLSFPRCFSSAPSSGKDGGWHWRDQVVPLLSDQLVAHARQLRLSADCSSDGQLLHVVSGCRLLCVTVAPAAGLSGASAGGDVAGRVRSLLVYSAGIPEAAECGDQADVDSVTQQLTVLLNDCGCSDPVMSSSGDMPESGGGSSPPQENSGCVCPLHKQLLHLIATDRCGQQLCVSWRRTGHHVNQKWLLLRLLAACSRRSPDTHLQLVVKDGRELRSLVTSDHWSSSVSSSLSSSSTWSTSDSGSCLSHIDRLQLLGGSRCVDVTSVGRLFPRLLALEILTRHRLDKHIQQQHVTNGVSCAPPEEERCVCRYRVSGGSAVQLEQLRVARLDTVCNTALAAIRSCAKQLCTLQLIECRLKAPRSVCIGSGRDRGGASGSGRAGGGVSGSGHGRSFREIIQTVLRRKVVTLPNIQIRALSLKGLSCPSASLVNSNFPCLKRLCVFMCSDSAGWSQTENIPLDVTGKDASAQLWFPSLEWLRIDYSGCSGGEGGDSEPLAMLQRPLRRLVHYSQSFGRLGWLRLMRACPVLQSVTLDPVMLSLPVATDSATSASSASAVQHLTVSWCDPETLERLTALTPALQRLRVMDPSVSDRNAWSGLVDSLRCRGVRVDLLW